MKQITEGKQPHTTSGLQTFM